MRRRQRPRPVQTLNTEQFLARYADPPKPKPNLLHMTPAQRAQEYKAANERAGAQGHRFAWQAGRDALQARTEARSAAQLAERRYEDSTEHTGHASMSTHLVSLQLERAYPSRKPETERRHCIGDAYIACYPVAA